MKKTVKKKNSKKQNKPLNNKYKTLIVLSIFLLVLIAVGITYALFNYMKEGSTENTIKSGTITFWYDEINQSGNSISIEDALPMSDIDGKQQTDAFNFKIESTTASTLTIPYEITLRQKQGTDNIGNIVKVYLAKTSAVDASIASEEEVELSLFSELSNVTKNGYSEKLLHTDLVPASDSPYTQFYRLKMWIDNNTDYSQVENDTTHEMEYPYNNKTFTVMVNVYANGHVLDENSSIATIDNVSVGGTPLAATPVSGIDTYTATLPEGTTQTTITVDTGDYDQVTVIKTESDYTTPVAEGNNIQRLSNTMHRKVNLTNGVNYFKVVATAEDQIASKEAHIKITVIRTGPLGELILEDNPTRYTNPTLTTSSNNTSDANGLYSINVSNGFSNGTNGTSYYFRGNVTNNKVKFAGFSWRVIRINEDGTVRLILDGSTDSNNHTYNDSCTGCSGIKYTYYSGSRVKSDVNTWYKNNITNKGYATYVATGNYFCEALKVKPAASNSSGAVWSGGSASPAVVAKYKPNLVCNKDGNNKQYVNSGVGFITYDELMLAGGYYNKANSTYYLYKNYYWWTMSPAGMSGQSGEYGAYIWRTYSNGAILERISGTTSGNTRLRPVINLKANTLATVDTNGTYVVQ